MRRKTTNPEIPEMSRRSFVKTAGQGLVAGLALAAASNFALPTIANSQGAETREVAGKKVKVTVLGDSFKKVDEETEKYRRWEKFPENNNGKYQNLVAIPNQAAVLVTFNYKTGNKGFNVLVDGQKEEVGTNLKPFAEMVKKETGQELKRVRILVETGEQDGTKFANIYVVPVDGSGKPTTDMGSGEYLIYGSTQFGAKVFADPYVMKDPKHQIVVAQR